MKKIILLSIFILQSSSFILQSSSLSAALPSDSSAPAQIKTTLGKDGWLFLDEEYLLGIVETKEDVVDTITQISQVAKALSDRNIQLVVAPVPIKARIYKNHFPYSLPVVTLNRYSTILQLLRASKVMTVDLNTPFLKLAQSSSDLLFFRLGTHWTTDGAFTAAQVIASTVKKIPSYSEIKEKRLSVSRQADTDSADSLLLMVPQVAQHFFPPQKHRPLSYEQVSASGSLLGEESPEIVLVGTSYSEPTFGFSNALQYSLERDVLNMAISGAGGYRSIDEYLRGDLFKTVPPKIIIWEIPERYFITPPAYLSLEQLLGAEVLLPAIKNVK